MDLPSSDPHAAKFVTNVGLVTSDGPIGPNIMACEWTHHSSYRPGLISIHIGLKKATRENILATGEFGIAIAGEHQNVLSSVAGRGSGRDIDKIGLLKELGFRFKKSERISPLTVEGVPFSAECKVVKTDEVGDHTMFVGEILVVKSVPDVSPILYHQGKYWKVGENIPKPDQDRLDEIAKMREKYMKT